MRDYAETVQAMRYAFEQPCYDCVLGEKCNWGDFCFFKRAADAIEELLAKVPHWISVEERLPEKSKIVLVAYDNGVVAQGMLFFGKFRGANFGFDENDEPIIAEVTHWMPLPEPPKGVE